MDSDEDEKWCNDNGLDYWALKYADNMRHHLARILAGLNLRLCSTPLMSCNYHQNIGKALLSGFFLHLAHLRHYGRYCLILKDSPELALYFSSSLSRIPKWVIYHTCFSDMNLMLTVTEVCDDWLVL